MEENNRLGTRYFDVFKSIVAIALLTVFVVSLLQGRALLYQLQSRAVTVLNAPESAPGGADTLLSGRGLPGATIEVLAGETQVGTTTIGADGTWSLAAPLPPGDVQLRARTIDAAGVTLSESEIVTWNVPEPSPAAPSTPLTMTGPQIGADGIVTLAGAGKPGTTVELLAGDVLLGAAPVGADGAWTLSTPLEPGDYQLQVRAVDEAGVVVDTTPVLAVTVPAAAPEIAAPLTLEAPAVDAEGNVTLTGSGAPDAAIEAVVNGQPVNTAIVDATGAWLLQFKLDPGEYQLQVRSAASTGGDVMASEPITITVAAPTGLLQLNPPEVGADGIVTLTGISEPGAVVELLAGEVALGEAAADQQGTWTLTAPITAGATAVRARIAGAEGGEVSETAPLSITLPVTSTSLLTESLAAGIAATASVTAAAGITATTRSITATPELAAASDLTTTAGLTSSTGLTATAATTVPANDDTTAADITGAVTETAQLTTTAVVTAPAGVTAVADITATADVSATAAVTKTSGVTPTAGIEAALAVTATTGLASTNVLTSETDLAATTGLTSTGALTVTDTLSAGIRSATAPGIGAGVALSTSISGTNAADAGALIVSLPEVGAKGAVTITGSGAPGAAVEVLVDEEPIGSTLVDDAGVWLLAVQLEPGVHAVLAQIAGETGAAVSPGSAISVTVPIEAVATTVDTPQIGTGGVFTITGTGEPGTKLEVMAGSLKLGTVTVASNGVWVLAKKVDPGQYQLQVREPGVAASTVTAAPSVTVTVPVEVAALSLDKPRIGTNGFITVSGAGAPGEQLEVLQDGKIVGVATVSEDGVWQLVSRVDSNGAYGFAVQQRDNAKTRTEPVTINVTNIIVAPAAVTEVATVTPTVTAATGAASTSDAEASASAGTQKVADALGGSAYTVVSGDTLTSIADEYLGNPALYTEIVAATNAMAAVDSSFKTITNPNLIAVGDKLWIPTPGK